MSKSEDQIRAEVHIYKDIADEREAQEIAWGQQDHPSIYPEYPPRRMIEELEMPSEVRAKALCEMAAKRGRMTYSHIVLEEFAESVEAQNDQVRRGELVQTAACLVAWIAAIDRRAARDTSACRLCKWDNDYSDKHLARAEGRVSHCEDGGADQYEQYPEAASDCSGFRVKDGGDSE